MPLQVVKGINYDIITPQCMEGFRHETWFDVKPGKSNPQALMILQCVRRDDLKSIGGEHAPFGSQANLQAAQRICTAATICCAVFSLYLMHCRSRSVRPDQDLHFSPVGSLPGGDKLVIGLNPPFGQDGTLAGAFAALAAHHRPRIIVLIVPPRTLVSPVLALLPARVRMPFSSLPTSAVAHRPSSQQEQDS